MKPAVAPVAQDLATQEVVSPVRVGDKDSRSRKPPLAPVSQEGQGDSGEVTETKPELAAELDPVPEP